MTSISDRNLPVKFTILCLRSAAVTIAWMLIFQSALSRSAQAEFDFDFDGHNYLLVDENRTWQEAASDASSRQLGGANGHLVIIESAAENQAIFDQLVANISVSEFNNTRAPDGGNGAYVWIAANDLGVEGNWIWDGNGDGVGDQFWQGTGSSGSAVDGRFSHWGNWPDPNSQWEPDNSQGRQHAGGMGLADWPRGFAGEWNDVRPENRLYYLVEFDTLGLACDLNDSGDCDIADIDLLMNEVAAGTNDEMFDLDNNGAVDDLDRDIWLASAGPANRFGGPLLLGDANLDGFVGARDLNAVGITWQTGNNDWSRGNFTGSRTDSADLNELGINWQKSVGMRAQTVPEPVSSSWVCIAVGMFCYRRSTGRRHCLGCLSGNGKRSSAI